MWAAKSTENLKYSDITFVLGTSVWLQPHFSVACCLPDAHDEIDHGNGVKIDMPKCHETEDTKLDRNDGKGYPERTHWVRNEDERNEHHDYGRNHNTLNGCREDHKKLNIKYV